MIMWVSMTQGQWITKSGGKMVEGPKPGLKISPEQAANASSYRGAVLKGREQGGEGREGQYYRNPIGNDGNKGKGLDGNRDGFSRPEAPKYKHKERFHRGYGEGSSLQGRQSGFHGPREKDRRFAPQTRDNQYRRGGNDGAQVFPEKLMLDAFKGAAQASKMSGLNENGVLDMPSKTRKALRFEEAPEAGSEPEKPTAEITEDLDGKSKSLDTVMGDAAPVTDASVAADTPLEEGEFSDSELLVDTDELQDWEQGEFEDYQEELEKEGSNAEGVIEEIVEEQIQDDKNKEDNQEKDLKKKVQKGGKRTAMSILSPRKKLLAKAVNKVGGKGGGLAKKA
ncbi:hypothetical protein Bca52824_015053 [Brassica carinata]|uniref:Uncharacterized protein n=1 Tax=Brassica carinata TaxID=52824 RepID=A0A8X7W3Z8_BRACI|nr:hypothetical protein Bca52824_015053 [Brassica carinata]